MPSLLEPQEAPKRGRVLLRTGQVAEIRPLLAHDATLLSAWSGVSRCNP